MMLKIFKLAVKSRESYKNFMHTLTLLRVAGRKLLIDVAAEFENSLCYKAVFFDTAFILVGGTL